MSVTGGLFAFGVRYLFDVSADRAVRAIEEWLTDHGQAVPKALAKANDRAWQAVGLALAGDTLLDRVKDPFRSADLRGVRDQVRAFLNQTPTGLDAATAGARVNAAEEWHRLRKAGRLAAPVALPDVSRRAATMERYGDPAGLHAAALRAVAETADALRPEAPHLAELLTAAPSDGPPLLAAAFAFFFRREVETNEELARGLSFDYLRRLSGRQEAGLELLDVRTAGILDQIDVLFDALGQWFAATDAQLLQVNAKLDMLVQLRDVPTSTSEPLKVTVTNKGELEVLQSLRDVLRTLPPERVAAANWTKLGDTLAAAGMFREAGEAHGAAAAAAQSAADRTAEAEAEYKRFRDACETSDRDTAMTAFRRAVELDSARFTPFDLHRYAPGAILGAGGFGTVFLADDLYVRVGKERRPQRVAIKAVHDSGWNALLERDLSEAFDEADTLSALNHPGIVKTLNRGFGDPAGRKRPYLVLEYFPGVTLEAWLKEKGPLSVADVLAIARQVAEAVHAAHRVGIYHRDVKPANVMVAFDEAGRQWRVKVIDFGLAVRRHVARTSMEFPAGRRSALDRSLAGTLRYAPPEQRNELDADVGAYSDVYAWGKTCLDMLFATTEPKSFHWKKLPGECRERLQDLLERATVDDLGHRFAGFDQVLEELAGLAGDRRPAGPGVGAAEIPFAGVIAEPPPLPAATRKPAATPPVKTPAPQPLPPNPKAGDTMTLRIPVSELNPKPGTLTTLTWEPVSTSHIPTK